VNFRDACEHGKTISPLMAKLLNRERVGTPQFVAGLLLLIFVVQCLWLIAHEFASQGLTEDNDLDRIVEGVGQWHGHYIAGTPTVPNLPSELALTRVAHFDSHHSPVWYLVGSLPVAVFDASPDTMYWIWLTRAPYLLFGTLLGASLWYVSRRLYGNAGGYIALTLYCFSPAVIRSSVLWFAQPNIGGVWGTFGAVFTAIALSHTLYAPREVVLWNWRRIVLLGISLALAVGSHFSLAIIIAVLLVLMLYVATERRGAAIVILMAAWVAGLGLLFSSYFFHPRVFWSSLSHAVWLEISPRAFAMTGAWLLVFKETLAGGPVLALLVPAALISYVAWRRTRYFGNAVPLFVSALFLGLRVATPHDPDPVFSLVAVVFLFLFVAGIAADFLETRFRELAASVLTGLLAANALWELIGLARIPR
jgi:hypothetical protein